MCKAFSLYLYWMVSSKHKLLSFKLCIQFSKCLIHKTYYMSRWRRRRHTYDLNSMIYGKLNKKPIFIFILEHRKALQNYINLETQYVCLLYMRTYTYYVKSIADPREISPNHVFISCAIGRLLLRLTIFFIIFIKFNSDTIV